MARISQVETHQDRQSIEIALVARVRLADIGDRYGLSIFALSRWRRHMRVKQREYFYAIRRTLLEKKVDRRVILEKWGATCR